MRHARAPGDTGCHEDRYSPTASDARRRDDRSVIHGTLTAPTGDRRDFHGMTEPLGSSGKSLRPWPRHRVPTRTAVTNVTDLGGQTGGESQAMSVFAGQAVATRAAPATNSIDPPAAGPAHTPAPPAHKAPTAGRSATGSRSDDGNEPFGLGTRSRALRSRSRGQDPAGGPREFCHARPSGEVCWRVRGDARPTMRMRRCSRRSTVCDTALTARWGCLNATDNRPTGRFDRRSSMRSKP
jgi:hypothetical protein